MGWKLSTIKTRGTNFLISWEIRIEEMRIIIRKLWKFQVVLLHITEAMGLFFCNVSHLNYWFLWIHSFVGIPQFSTCRYKCIYLNTIKWNNYKFSFLNKTLFSIWLFAKLKIVINMKVNNFNAMGISTDGL